MRIWKVAAGMTALAAVMLAAPSYADDDNKAALVNEAQATLDRCKDMSDACANSTAAAAGVLVFPEVTSASLGIGGAGAKGVMWVNGQVDGVYKLGEMSIGPQFGVKTSSQVYALNAEALSKLRDEGSWKIGTEAEVTVVGAGATDDTASGQGGTAAFVFDEKGFAAGASVEGVTISRAGDDKF
jgi:lipid-binding SYLF domain-containing protein